MADSMRTVPWLRAEIWSSGRFCGGRVVLAPPDSTTQPILLAGSPRRFWIDGNPRRSLDWSNLSRAEELASLLSDGGQGLAGVDGPFALAALDPEGLELVLATDRLGLRPLYYFDSEDWFAYAGEVKAVLAALDGLPDLDEIALRQFFGLDHLMANRTWWKGLRLLPPAGYYRVKPEGQTQRRYWTFDEIPFEPMEEEEVGKRFEQLWKREVEICRRPGTMPLLLSGGLDSRFLLVELQRQEAELLAVTFGSEDSPDMTVARRVTSLAGIPHRECLLDIHNWWHRREEGIWTTDGMVNALHLHSVAATDEMHTGSFASLVNAAGDLLFGGSHLVTGLSDVWQEHAESLLDRRLSDNPFFSREEILEASREDLPSLLEGPSSDCFFLLNRWRRLTLTGPGSLSRHCTFDFPGTSLPFLHLFLGSLSGEQRRGGHFYRGFLLRRYPRFFENVPVNELSPERARPWFLLRRAARLPWAAARRLGWSPRSRKPRRSPHAWFVDYPACLEHHRVSEKLQAEPLLLDWYLNGAVRRSLTRKDVGAPSVTNLLAVLTLETYLRQVYAVKTTSLGSEPCRSTSSFSGSSSDSASVPLRPQA